MAIEARIGVLFSTSGPYGALGRDCLDGADLALAEIAAAPHAAVRFEAVRAEPAGDPRTYVENARAMLREAGCRHIVGTVTSIARKEVIPLVEKHDGLLWYVCPYEGFEANENVVYTGGCPNQHLIPLFEHLLPRYGRRAYLLGANYVWGWEMNRLARELLMEAGGEVLGERCLPLEETDVARIIADIEQRRPSFVLNNLIGPSSHAFLRAMRALGDRDPAFGPDACPVVSCDLSECELPAIGLDVATGQFSTAAYFDSVDTGENKAFKTRAAAVFGPDRRLSTYVEAAYSAVHMLAAAIAATGTDEPAAVRAALPGLSLDTPHGPMRIDPRTNHAALPFRLGRIRADGGFDVVAQRPAIAADPYLTAARAGSVKASLRVVS